MDGLDAERGGTARIESAPEGQAPRLASAVVVAVAIGFFTVAFAAIVDGHPSPSGWLVGMAVLAALLVLQVIHSSGSIRARLSHATPWTLTAQALLTYVPYVMFGATWLGIPGFFAGSVLIIVSFPYSWLLFSGTVFAEFFIAQTLGESLGGSIYAMMSTCITGLVVFGLARLSILVHELYVARAELARLAVTRERLRFARDLHDLLGHSLSVIALKNELAYRLVESNPSGAQEELADTIQVVREALTDVRAVARGFREVSLQAELTSARLVLQAASIECRLAVVNSPASLRVDSVLAFVLRESITNVLRHSKAQVCIVEAIDHDGWIHLTVTNDGIAQELPENVEVIGSGIQNMRDRIIEVGGELDIQHESGGYFSVIVKVPHETPAGTTDTDEPTRSR